MNPDELISQEDPNGGTEYGGVGGMIQPSPHDPQSTGSEHEVLWLMYHNPSDEMDEAGNSVSTFTPPDTRLIAP